MGSMMSIEISIIDKDDYVLAEYSGEYQGDISSLKLDDLVKDCKQCKLLADITRCKLNVTYDDRFRFGEEIAKKFIFPKLIKIAMLMSPKQYNTFVSIVAQNRGASYEIFTDKKEALNWLLK
jgi:hypothetical protein